MTTPLSPSHIGLGLNGNGTLRPNSTPPPADGGESTAEALRSIPRSSSVPLINVSNHQPFMTSSELIAIHSVHAPGHGKCIIDMFWG